MMMLLVFDIVMHWITPFFLLRAESRRVVLRRACRGVVGCSVVCVSNKLGAKGYKKMSMYIYISSNDYEGSVTADEKGCKAFEACL